MAFRALLAVFPFLIFTSSMTAFIGERPMADDLISFLVAIVPPALVEPIVAEVEKVMTVQRGGVLSIGILLTIWFAVGGVDGVRVGLNRAYGIRETRSKIIAGGRRIRSPLGASGHQPRLAELKTSRVNKISNAESLTSRQDRS